MRLETVYLLLIVIVNYINVCQVDSVTKAPCCWTRSSGFSTVAGKPRLDTAAVVSLGSLHIKTLCITKLVCFKGALSGSQNMAKPLHIFPLGMFPWNVKQCHFQKTPLKVALAMVWIMGIGYLWWQNTCYAYCMLRKCNRSGLGLPETSFVFFAFFGFYSFQHSFSSCTCIYDSCQFGP